MIDLFREIAQILAHNKMRTFLTGIAVAWGIFMLIVLLGMSRGVLNNFNSFESAENAATVSIWPGSTEKSYCGYREGRSIELKRTDINAIAEHNRNNVNLLLASKVINNVQISTPRDYIADGLFGVFPENQHTDRINIIKGRFINQSDLDTRRKVIVINSQTANVLFGEGVDAIGKRVDAFGLSWLVIGVYIHDWNKASFIPFTTAMTLTGSDGTVSNIAVKIKNVSTTEEGDSLDSSLRRTLAKQHSFAPDDQNAVHIWNRFTGYLTALKATTILEIAVWLIGIFTMLSGIVGVSNIMFVSVRERTHEIGIRRAIGAKPRSILTQIVVESITITTLFGYIGIVCGTLLTNLIAKLTEGSDMLVNPTVDISIAFKVTLVLIVAGALAGLAPALKAIKIKPVEALHDE
ncbi:MAG: ABC transporter permease [Muribaculaceae bacterium]|nr:ABC transporter permease [Muribaculaceae bacterium]